MLCFVNRILVDELLKTISALTGDRRFEDEMNQKIVRKDGGIMRLEFLDKAEESLIE